MSSQSCSRDRSAGPLEVPCTIQVKNVVSNRYGIAPRQGDAEFELNRPLSWEERIEGIDSVSTACGHVVPLRSGGGQSVPQPGWKLYLTGGNSQEGYTWTLYGIPPVAN